MGTVSLQDFADYFDQELNTDSDVVHNTIKGEMEIRLGASNVGGDDCMRIDANTSAGLQFAIPNAGIIQYSFAGPRINCASGFNASSLYDCYKVNDVTVVCEQQAAVADATSPNATDLASAITLVNELKTQLNLALSRLRAHGLIDT